MSLDTATESAAPTIHRAPADGEGHPMAEAAAADLRGRTTEQRAEALAAIAHPSVREALLRGEDDVVVA